MLIMSYVVFNIDNRSCLKMFLLTFLE